MTSVPYYPFGPGYRPRPNPDPTILTNPGELDRILATWDRGDGKADPYFCACCRRHRTRSPGDGNVWEGYLCPTCISSNQEEVSP